ncbi:MAG: hypothetical protein R2795_07050 [Saprospiraceae bacterium]
MIEQALALLDNPPARKTLAQNARQMAYPGAAEKIAREVVMLANWKTIS